MSVTPNKVIESVDSIKPNSYDEETKLSWISELDGNVTRLVFQEDSYTPYSYPDDMDKELLISSPFDSVYGLYLQAMIDYHNREFGNYNNSAAMFETRYNDYKKDYIRKHRAKG